VAGIANGGVRNLGRSNDFPVGGVYQFGCPLGTPFMSCTDQQRADYETAVNGSCPIVVEYVFRATVATGVVPAFIALMLSRYLLVETPRYTSHVMKDNLRAITDLASQGEPYAALVANAIDFDSAVAPHADADLTCCGFIYFHGWNLVAVSLCWFLFNTGFYGLIIASRDASTVLGFTQVQKIQSSVDETDGTIRAYVALVVASLIPGYYAVVLTVDLIGRKLLQFLGFILFGIFLASIAGSRRILLQPNNASQYDMSMAGQDYTGMKELHTVRANGWIVLFILTFFFASWGPLTTTYIIPAEIFPTRWRGTGYGISAAFGTIGSITGIFGFLYASQPAANETQYAWPCKDRNIGSDLASDGSCLKLNFCPIGRTVPGGDFPGGSPVGAECSICNLKSKSGCAGFGLGPAGALGVLVTILFAGAISTLALPLTTQRSLEDINYQNETDAPREFVMFDTFDAEGVVVNATAKDMEVVTPSVQV
jgi:Sugar (and other) transporter